jgi:hypothetical protein
MASIFSRKDSDGSISWRVQIRRKGLRTFCTCFNSKDEAEKFAKENEKKYCLDSDNFTFDRLKRRRENEFSRK